MKRNAVALMRSASKMKAKETSHICTVCGSGFFANPIQFKVWKGKCYQCFITGEKNDAV